VNWKGELAQILTFAIAPALGALAAWWSVRSPRVAGWDDRLFRRVAVGAWLATRLGTYAIVFHVFRYAGGHDLLSVWVPIARTVLEGGDPAPLVDNLYGPLYPHVLAAGLWLGGGHAPATGLGFLLGDAASLVLVHRLARRRLDAVAARRVLLLVLLSPMVWHGLAVRMQDEPLFLACLLLVQDLLDRRREGWAAAASAIGVLLTKALLPLYLLPVLLAADGTWRERLRRVFLAGGATIAALALAVLAGWRPVTSAHGTLGVRGSSAWWLITDGSAPREVFLAGLGFTAVACIAAAVFANRRVPGGDAGDRAARGVSATQSAFFVASPFVLPPHLAHGMAHVAWHVVRAGAARTRPPLSAHLLLVPLLGWQVVFTWLNPELAHTQPWVVAAFVTWCAFAGWHAIAARWPRDA
jgi:hypothetical protein